MKKLFFSIFALLLFLSSHAQSVSREEMLPLFKSLDAENWQESLDITQKLIKAYPNDSSDFRCLVNYASILSGAGLVSEGKWEYAQLDTHLKQFVGKKMIMSAHPTTSDTTKVGFDLNMISVKNHQCKVSTTTTNKLHTNIFYFEYVFPEDEVDPKKCNGFTTRCRGTLDKFELNPNKSGLWIGRLYVEKGDIRAIH